MALERIREEAFSDNTLIVLTRHAGSEDHKPTGAGIELEQASVDDAKRYARDIGTETPGTFRARLSEETLCFVARSDGSLLHATWVTTQPTWTREVRRYFTPPAGDVYVFESFTRAEARGRGIYPLILQAIAEWSAEKRLNRLWAGVTADNHPSLRAISKAGFTEAFRTAYHRRLGRLVLDPATGPLEDMAPRCLSSRI